jgi:hypothetical protein
MSGFRVALIVSAIALSSIAYAEEPAPNAQVLGTVEALLGFCAKADPASAAQYREQLKQLTQGSTEKALAEARKKDEYRQGHALVDESVAKIDQAHAKKVCSESLAENK